MFHVEQFRAEILRPALLELQEWTMGAEELLVLTCATESLGGTYFKQVGGDALGAYQMSPATHNDIWDSYISRHSTYAYKILNKLGRGCKPGPEIMKYDLMYATFLARIFYLRFKEPIPDATNIKGLAEYWKKYFNTDLGSGTVEKAIEDYNHFTGAKNKVKSKK